jgi:hypothetical protein
VTRDETNAHEPASAEDGVPDGAAEDKPPEGGSSSKEKASKDMYK